MARIPPARWPPASRRGRGDLLAYRTSSQASGDCVERGLACGSRLPPAKTWPQAPTPSDPMPSNASPLPRWPAHAPWTACAPNWAPQIAAVWNSRVQDGRGVRPSGRSTVCGVTFAELGAQRCPAAPRHLGPAVPGKPSAPSWHVCGTNQIPWRGGRNISLLWAPTDLSFRSSCRHDVGLPCCGRSPLPVHGRRLANRVSHDPWRSFVPYALLALALATTLRFPPMAQGCAGDRPPSPVAPTSLGCVADARLVEELLFRVRPAAPPLERERPGGHASPGPYEPGGCFVIYTPPWAGAHLVDPNAKRVFHGPRVFLVQCTACLGLACLASPTTSAARFGRHC